MYVKTLVFAAIFCVVIPVSYSPLAFSAQQQQHSASSASHNYLELAVQTADWLDSVAIQEKHGLQWPTVPQQSPASSNILYSGNSGVVLFYLHLYRATKQQHHLDQAIAGVDSLVHYVHSMPLDSDSSFWSGIAGIAYTLNQLYQETDFERFVQAEQKCFEHIRRTAYSLEGTVNAAVAWNDVTDVIGGTAGIGFYLLDRFQRTQDDHALQLAVQAGDGLLHLAIATEPIPTESGDVSGLKWMMSPAVARNMPNYSHGTAGICDFLVVLDAISNENKVTAKNAGRFLEAATKGAYYLQSLCGPNATPNAMIPHHLPADGPLFYLGWCHGPAGTVCFLDRLTIATQDRRWTELGDRLTEHLLSCGIPRERPGGFWNNVGVCCGNAGVASFLIDRNTIGDNARYEALIKELVDDLVAKATKVDLPDGNTGLFWNHAEHRSRPEFLQAQTGLMQGAAGIGMLLLKLDAVQQKRPANFRLPVAPF